MLTIQIINHMEKKIVNAVRAIIKKGYWFSQEEGSEANDAKIENDAFKTSLTDDDILMAAKEVGTSDIKLIAKVAMSNKIGAAVGLNVKN